MVTLLSSKTAAVSTGTQVQVMGSADAGWTMHLTTEESPEVEQINISSPTVVTGVLRVKGAPSTAEEAVILFPYFPFQEARAVYTARMTYWWCKETGEGCDAYQAWKATSPHVVSVTVVEPEVEAAIESAPAAVVATTTDRAEVVVPDWQRRPVVETEVDGRGAHPAPPSKPAAGPRPRVRTRSMPSPAGRSSGAWRCRLAVAKGRCDLRSRSPPGPPDRGRWSLSRRGGRRTTELTVAPVGPSGDPSSVDEVPPPGRRRWWCDRVGDDLTAHLPMRDLREAEVGDPV